MEEKQETSSGRQTAGKEKQEGRKTDSRGREEDEKVVRMTSKKRSIGETDCSQGREAT